MRLWTFSPRIKAFLIDVYQMKSEEIGIIGRFPSSKKPSAPDFNQTVNLVYAGRLSLTKNITSLIRLTSLLQTHFKRDVTLDLFGKTDNFPDESIGRFTDFSMNEEIEELIKRLLGKINPSFMHLFLNMNGLTSTALIPYSLASQAPCMRILELRRDRLPSWLASLLSNWGGHGSANHNLLVPMHLVARTYEPVFLQNYKTLTLATQLIDNSLPFCHPLMLSQVMCQIEFGISKV